MDIGIFSTVENTQAIYVTQLSNDVSGITRAIPQDTEKLNKRR